MDEIRIQRINELARKSKTPSGLTEQEKAEQKILRQEYIASYAHPIFDGVARGVFFDGGPFGGTGVNGNKHKVEKKK